MLEIPQPADFQALQDYCGVDAIQSMDFPCKGILQQAESVDSRSSISPASSQPQSLKGTAKYFRSLRASIAIPTSYCCYQLVYTTVESLHFRASQYESGNGHKSLDVALSVCKTAASNVLKMLACTCFSDPHLAMLYSSITSKILS